MEDHRLGDCIRMLQDTWKYYDEEQRREITLSICEATTSDHVFEQVSSAMEAEGHSWDELLDKIGLKRDM